LHQTVQKIPGGPNAQVAVGSAVILGLCAVPVFGKDTKRGHDLFSQEKPQAIVESQERLQKEAREAWKKSVEETKKE